MRCDFIAVQKAHYPVTTLCRVLQVSRSAVYAARGHAPACRRVRDDELSLRIRTIHAASRGTYGSPRVHAALQREAQHVARKRVARLMAVHGLCGRRPKRWCRTTDSTHSEPIAPNVLARRFTVGAPNQVWATDITYVWTSEGWLYLAVVLDLFARRVVGWGLAERLHTELPLVALRMALGRRAVPRALVHHSDRGTQYASAAYQQELRAYGIQCSMSRRGNCWDNAVVESFFATLKIELIHRRAWPTRREVREAISEYIELFYNAHRLHSSAGYRSPNDREKEFMLTAATAA